MLFEKQEYQESCVSNILQVLEYSDAFNGRVSLREGLEQLCGEQNIPVSDLKDDFRLDILMETGTGKTFTYLKTMYEINRRHGVTKFLIFVPRLAIRAGIIQNINLTADYFFQEYGKRLKQYVYGDKNGLHQVENYISNEREFSVLILTSASITGQKKQSKILTRANESLLGAVAPLEAISKLKPIMFIDEPHLLKGEGFTNTYDKYFSESLLLRFGATFPQEAENQLSNVVYTLDSITAFRDYLVKRISVSTVTDENSSIKFYRGGRNGLSLYYFKDGIEHKANITHGQNISTVTGDKAHDFHSLRVKQDKVILSNGTKQDLSSPSYDIADDTVREMIKATIALHFEKEKDLFDRGIKALSLFFIPSVADFRGDNPRIKIIFEEEYTKQRQEKLQEPLSDSYHEYLNKDYDNEHRLCVHQGYFSGDKGTNQEKENYGINLILNDKERLLSTQEPLRFIFSVWALQEGWDNPNILTICKLASTSKETTRRQQVGRGLRLVVDRNGRRQTIKSCEDSESRFYEVNTLDVVVSGQEKNFIEGIQNEITKGSLTAERLTRAGLLKLGLNASQVNRLSTWLEDGQVISLDESGDEAWHINMPVADFLVENKDNLPDKLSGLKEKYDMLVDAFKKSVRPPVVNRNRKQDKVGIRADKFKEFESLWHTITNKAEIIYRNVDDDKLIANVKASFENESVPVIERKVEKRTYDHQNNQIVFEKQTFLGRADIFSEDQYAEFVANFAEQEKLPLQFCLKLFRSLDKEKISSNPKRAYELISKFVKDHIHSNVIESIDYEFKGEIAIDTRSIFYRDNKCSELKEQMEASYLGKYTDTSSEPKAAYLYDKICYDSKIERDIVNDDPERVGDDRIVVFAKLPRLSIPTPYKSYSPDFAYYIRTTAEKKLFLVVETKGYDSESDIPADEKKKIQYGERFFNALSQYAAQTSEAKVLVKFRKRINKQELAYLLKDIGANE